MPGDQQKIWEKFKRPGILIPTLAGPLLAGGTIRYLILLNPGSIFVRWALAALPTQITKISLSPYPEENDFRRLKRDCFLRNGQPVMALRQFDTVLEQVPDEASALIGLGLSYLQLGNKPAAADLFRRVLAMDPANEEARRYLKEALAR